MDRHALCQGAKFMPELCRIDLSGSTSMESLVLYGKPSPAPLKSELPSAPDDGSFIEGKVRPPSSFLAKPAKAPISPYHRMEREKQPFGAWQPRRR